MFMLSDEELNSKIVEPYWLSIIKQADVFNYVTFRRLWWKWNYPCEEVIGVFSYFGIGNCCS